MRLSDVIKFQKALALAARASNAHEAAAAELAVRRLVTGLKLDPTRIPNRSFIADIDFADNALAQETARGVTVSCIRRCASPSAQPGPTPCSTPK